MILPPAILRIKRKRGDDPVESLYFEPQQSGNKRRVTTSGIEFVFKRLVEHPNTSSPLQNATDGPAQPSNGIPQVIATAPGEEDGFFRRKQTPTPAVGAQKPLSQETGQTSATLPRRFHLSRDAAPAPAQASSRKRRGSGSLHKETNVAVFVEDLSDLKRLAAPPQQNGNDSGARNSSSMVAQSLTPGASPQKRPRTPATGSRPLTPSRQVNDDAVSEIHAALQKYAAEEHSRAQSIEDGRRRAGPTKDPDAMEVVSDGTSASLHGDGEFIYDTYVRYANTLDDLPSKLSQTSLDGGTPASGTAGSGTIGYLVIPEADQTLWETYYASDASSNSERDWDSEEDDENHENYYGADYPEDEVSSEDDRDENPYRYALGEGDDEDSDDDEEAWSGDEGDRRSRPPWRPFNHRYN